MLNIIQLLNLFRIEQFKKFIITIILKKKFVYFVLKATGG